MKVSDWLDEKEAENVGVSQITLPTNLAEKMVADRFGFHY